MCVRGNWELRGFLLWKTKQTEALLFELVSSGKLYWVDAGEENVEETE